MKGMDKHTGKWLDGIEHVKQSFKTIISTVPGERLMRRNIGFNRILIDELFDGDDSEIAYETAVALREAKETRIKLRQVNWVKQEPVTSNFKLKINATYLDVENSLDFFSPYEPEELIEPPPYNKYIIFQENMPVGTIIKNLNNDNKALLVHNMSLADLFISNKFYLNGQDITRMIIPIKQGICLKISVSKGDVLSLEK